MRRLRVAVSVVVPALALTALAHALVACGDDDNAASTPRDGGSTDANDDLPIATGDATPPDEDAGAFVVEEVADTPCAASANAGTVLYAGANDAIVSISKLGARRLGQRGLGFVLFDANGANPSANVIGASLAATAVDDDTIAAVASGNGGPTVSLYDASGIAKVLDVPAHDTLPFGLTIGGGGAGTDIGGSALMVWASSFGVFARGLTSTAFVGPPFALAASGSFNAFSASVARKNDGSFGVAFSGEELGNASAKRLSFVPATTTGRIAQGFNLELGATSRRVVQLAPLAKGWALLFDYGSPPTAHLAILDDQGRIAGPIRRLAGAGRAFGLASSGGELGVVALHDPASLDADAGIDAGEDAGDDAGGEGGAAPVVLPRAAFRPFDERGAPLGGWICYGEGVASGVRPGAIAGEDNGYAIAWSKPNGDIVHTRIDLRGN